MSTSPQTSGPLLPKDVALKAEDVGVIKARMAPVRLFTLGVMAGAFIGLGAMAATTISTGLSPDVPFGLARVLSGMMFTLGLILTVLGGAELFTGNVLMVMAVASRRMDILTLSKAWGIVFVGNLLGAVSIAILIFLAGHHFLDGGETGKVAIAISVTKANLTFVQAFFLGILCNLLVCLAVWLSYSAASTTDKILAIVLPIATFVAAGFEHSIANMYFFAQAVLIDAFASGSFDFGNAPGFAGIVANLVPVTLGNIFGGGVMVGLVYWFVYVRTVRH